MSSLTGMQKSILDFEKTWANDTSPRGTKEQAIRTEYGFSATSYYQRLNALLDDRDALEYAPATVNRLRDLRATRAARRSD